MLDNNAERLKRRSNIVKSLVEAINTAMSETHDQKYFSEILNKIPVEYVNIQQGIAESESNNSTFSTNNAILIDEGVETKGIRSNIFVFADNWSSDDNLKTDTLINTLLYALQQSHYITTENLNVKENKSNHNSEEFDRAIKDAINIFKESTVGREWIVENNNKGLQVVLGEEYTTSDDTHDISNEAIEIDSITR